jgi:cytochrome c oxidase assembly factor CtaG
MLNEVDEKLKSTRVVSYIAILLVVLTASVAYSDSLEYYSYMSLSFHMTIEHSIFLGSGALLATIGSYCLQAFTNHFSVRGPIQLLRFSNLTKLQRKETITIVSCLVASGLLMGVWHLPSLFAAATVHEDLHLLQHTSFIISGSLGFIAIRMMPVTLVILSLVLMNATMGLFGALLVVSNHQIFIPYSIEGHAEAGNVMIALSIVMAIVAFPAFIISRSLGYELKNQQNI